MYIQAGRRTTKELHWCQGKVKHGMLDQEFPSIMVTRDKMLDVKGWDKEVTS